MKKIMLNQKNVHETTLTLDEAYDRFEKYSKSKNLVDDTIDTYYKNYKYFWEFLEYYQEQTRNSYNKMQSNYRRCYDRLYCFYERQKNYKGYYYKYSCYPYKSVFYVLF